MQKKTTQGRRGTSQQSGFALLMALIAVSLFSVIGLYLSLAATTAVRISDNYESTVQARAAALAGLNHAQAMLRGLRFDDLLSGPDGVHDADQAYIDYAQSDGYRTPVAWNTARILNLLDPQAMLENVPDDGLLNSGRQPAGDGVILIPGSGIVRIVPGPEGSEDQIVSRYFVKVADNNGEAAELAGDPQDDPFVDGDGQIIVRSMGIARSLAEYSAAGIRRNSVVLLEARFRRCTAFALQAPVVLQGSLIEPAGSNMFSGESFFVQGGSAHPGIATIDTTMGTGAATAVQILARLAPAQDEMIQGEGIIPSVRDLTSVVCAHPDQRLLLDKGYIRGFARKTVPEFADIAYAGNQNWAGAAPASLGSYDPALPPGSPGQDPRVTLVEGDLIIDGDLAGGGLLVVTGRLAVRGRFRFNGLILAIGAGEFECSGLTNITGGVYVTSLRDSAGNLDWGIARLALGGSCRIIYDRETIDMAVSLIPPIQQGFREITSLIDP